MIGAAVAHVKPGVKAIWLRALSLALIAVGWGAAGCGAGASPKSSLTGGRAGNTASSGAGGGPTFNLPTSGGSNGGGSGTPILNVANAGATANGGAAATTERCDDAGQCTCFAIASFGLPGGYGVGPADSTNAFQTWLDEKSSAQLQVYATHTPITKALLENYGVVIIQGLLDNEQNPRTFWTFSPDELSALQDWVTAGGGLITLSGYSGSPAEVAPVNQLLAFTGIAYASDDILTTCNDPAATAYPTADCACWGSSVPFSGFLPGSAIGTNIQKVGVLYGRSLNRAPGATVVAELGSTVLGVTMQVGKGRVFAFADEWVTYTSQWGAANQPQTSVPSCVGYTADQYFQVPQFWYNSIKWVSANATCFDITDPAIVK